LHKPLKQSGSKQAASRQQAGSKLGSQQQANKQASKLGSSQ